MATKVDWKSLRGWYPAITGFGGLIWIVLHYPKREQTLFINLFLEMVHNKNKHSKLPAKPSDSWISSDLWLKIAFSKCEQQSKKWQVRWQIWELLDKQ